MTYKTLGEKLFDLGPQASLVSWASLTTAERSDWEVQAAYSVGLIHPAAAVPILSQRDQFAMAAMQALAAHALGWLGAAPSKELKRMVCRTAYELADMMIETGKT